MGDKQNEVFTHRCKYCESEDLEYFTIEPNGEVFTQDIECKSCGKTFLIFTETKWYIEED